MRLTTLVCDGAAGSNASAAAGAASAAGAGTASAAGAGAGSSGATACGWAGRAPVRSSCPGGGAAGAAACVAGAGAAPFLPGFPGAGAASAFWFAAFDRGRIVLVRLAGAAGDILLAIFEGGGEIRIGRAVERDGLIDLLSGIAIDVKLGRRRAARLADARVLRQMAGIGLIAHREEEAVAGAHADRPVASVRIDAAIDRTLRLRRLLLVSAAASEPAEQASSHRCRGAPAAASACRRCTRCGRAHP